MALVSPCNWSVCSLLGFQVGKVLLAQTDGIENAFPQAITRFGTLHAEL